METKIKKTIKSGNSSAVVLPRAWLNKEVKVELIKKTPEEILNNTLEILKDKIPLKSIMGVYLTGSYARGEETQDSDIDILVITDNIDKEMINREDYNILIVSHQLINQKLKQDLLPIGPMIKEAKPLINRDFIKNLEVKVTKKNIKWYLKTTKEKLNIINKYLKNTNKKYLEDKTAYTLVLRIRTLEIIKKLLKNKTYSKKEFIKLIKKITNKDNAYKSYKNIKDNLNKKSTTSLKEAIRLYDYLEKDLTKIKKLINP